VQRKSSGRNLCKQLRWVLVLDLHWKGMFSHTRTLGSSTLSTSSRKLLSTTTPERYLRISVPNLAFRQRYQYKLRMQQRFSTITDERKAKLDGLGFIWHPHRTSWEEKYQSICDFNARYGHCGVPSRYDDKNLAIWVKVSPSDAEMSHIEGGGGAYGTGYALISTKLCASCSSAAT
jgi:Helicase associated domain